MAVLKSDASHIITSEKATSGVSLRKKHGEKDFDRAHQYILNATAGAETHTPVDLKALRRKIDWKIVPLMFCCYTIQFVDKVLLNYAGVMGMNQQLGLVGNNFSNAASVFYIAYLIAEIPNGAYESFGFDDANGHIDTNLTAPRFAVWYCGVGAGQIIAGLVSYIFQQVNHQAIAGWQIMFLVLGAVTILLGVVTFFLLPNTPFEARFLSEGEKLALLNHVSVNRTGIENKNVKLWQLLEGLLDPQLWLLTILTILISISSGVITTYSATVIRSFGFSSPISALLNMPSGVVSIAYSLLTGYGVRHTSYRWAWIVLCCASGVIGGGLLSFMPKSNRAGLLAGIYLVNAITATLGVIYQWTSSNVAGQTKRVASMALISGSFGVGNIVGPQTFQAKDAPQYLPAKITVLATQASGALVAAVLFLYYLWANKRRDSAMSSLEVAELESDSDPSIWENLTDKENKLFRYVY
ncbi:hypothetical protein MMC07_008474 [Pseudocyphellaria aurata]|nr:hypothetical protein [Pseudocyphellaria aurata]